MGRSGQREGERGREIHCLAANSQVSARSERKRGRRSEGELCVRVLRVPTRGREGERECEWMGEVLLLFLVGRGEGEREDRRGRGEGKRERVSLFLPLSESTLPLLIAMAFILTQCLIV